MRKTFFRSMPFALMAVLVLVLAAATVVEKDGSASGNVLPVYDRWWFEALWGLLAVASVPRLVQVRLWRRPVVFLLHVALLLMLAGAELTHLTSCRGTLHLRQGETAVQYLMPEAQSGLLQVKSLPFSVRLDSFCVVRDRNGMFPLDYVSHITVGKGSESRCAVVRMNHIAREQGFRIYQNSYDADGRGSLFAVSYDPWGTGVTYAGYALLGFCMCVLGVRGGRDDSNQSGISCNSNGSSQSNQSRNSNDSNHFSNPDNPGRKGRAVPWLVTLCGVLLASYMIVSIAFRPLVPILRSPLLVVHVGVILLGYVLLVVSLVRRQVLRLAVFLLATGIFLGAVWANISWGSYWSWDPKETWALITLMLYCVPLHARSLPWFRSDVHYRIYSLLCLLSLLMTYFGVTFLLGGMHSYAVP